MTTDKKPGRWKRFRQWLAERWCMTFGHDWKNITVDYRFPTYYCPDCGKEINRVPGKFD